MTAELPLLFYNKVDKKSLGKIGCAIKMNKLDCKQIGHRIHEDSGLKCLVYDPIEDSVIVTYTITLDVNLLVEAVNIDKFDIAPQPKLMFRKFL